MLVFTLLLPTICFADTDDYVHADFYRGLVGLKKQVDESNRDLLLLENASFPMQKLIVDLRVLNKILMR